jgi:hypothetical protein
METIPTGSRVRFEITRSQPEGDTTYTLTGRVIEAGADHDLDDDELRVADIRYANGSPTGRHPSDPRILFDTSDPTITEGAVTEVVDR